MTNSSHPSNTCPKCQSEIHSQENALFGEFECPDCQAKLWFLAAANEARFFDYEASSEMRDKTYEFVAERFEIERERIEDNPKILDELDIDSLEALEMLMDLEEELGLVE